MIQPELSVTKETEYYIEHEIKLRVLKEVNDERFLNIDKRFIDIDKRFDRLESKFNWTIGFVITGIVVPILLHGFKLT